MALKQPQQLKETLRFIPLTF